MVDLFRRQLKEELTLRHWTILVWLKLRLRLSLVRSIAVVEGEVKLKLKS